MSLNTTATAFSKFASFKRLPFKKKLRCWAYFSPVTSCAVMANTPSFVRNKGSFTRYAKLRGAMAPSPCRVFTMGKAG